MKQAHFFQLKSIGRLRNHKDVAAKFSAFKFAGNFRLDSAGAALEEFDFAVRENFVKSYLKSFDDVLVHRSVDNYFARNFFMHFKVFCVNTGLGRAAGRKTKYHNC